MIDSDKKNIIILGSIFAGSIVAYYLYSNKPTKKKSNKIRKSILKNINTRETIPKLHSDRILIKPTMPKSSPPVRITRHTTKKVIPTILVVTKPSVPTYVNNERKISITENEILQFLDNTGDSDSDLDSDCEDKHDDEKKSKSDDENPILIMAKK